MSSLGRLIVHIYNSIFTHVYIHTYKYINIKKLYANPSRTEMGCFEDEIFRNKVF